MAKAKTIYSCTECGASEPKWQGQCPSCMAWNTLVESIEETTTTNRYANKFEGLAQSSTLQKISSIKAADIERIPTGISEFDRVLGGGLVEGGVVLIGGDPGIGKSTLLLQVLCHLGKSAQAIYVSGEESPQQIAMRAKRLGLDASEVELLAEINLEKILATLQTHKPNIAVIDSIQTVYSEALQSAPGSVAQVRECSAQLTRMAKQLGITVILVGHVTKEGSLAGPRVLEHIVDTVLYFEGDQNSSFRLIRAFKNRFGAVNELGVFAMTEHGLREVSNPSALFLSHHEGQVAGSCITVTMEGTRPLLIEIQALVDESHAPNAKRLATGLEQNRLAMLLAVLNRHAGIPCFDQDVFINAVGGVKIAEPAVDLAVILSIVSSLKNKPLDNKLIVFGEVGLAGEVRPVQGGQMRLKEAAKLGFTKAIVPKANAPKTKISGIEVIAVERLEQALNQLRNS
ncbi:MAG: DNA repair protein RadA [Methylotenera sp.]|uniref:DNA repair protein RadA n=1 Tax=Methylotenera sp. TaxID=2051956 RepID=UPI002724535C|nr:DNA repair protein RadA [Methylotenera sp.]MDO9394182.1 DNA repair protein RadA [Methylotenera sp.]MDP1523310.1 DNA repair protein RadA [Methylotenera sp.]MDZ4210856.1 DNA repair protein RadA [Methylotenera sp.]